MQEGAGFIADEDDDEDEVEDRATRRKRKKRKNREVEEELDEEDMELIGVVNEPRAEVKVRQRYPDCAENRLTQV